MEQQMQDPSRQVPPPYSLEEIVKNGLCMGCGLCRAAFPDAITATMEADGLQRPRQLRPLDPTETVDLNRLCPGVRISAPSAPLGPRGSAMWGPIQSITRGYAADPGIRFRAASGGSLTMLAIHLLETGQVESILHVRADPARPLLSLVAQSRSREDVIASSGSRYSAAAPLLTIAQVLDAGRPFALIGKPCDVTGLANLARLDPRVDQLCKFRLCMVCGGFSELSRFRELLNGWDMQEDDLAQFSFRGNGCPGPTAASTKDGRHRETTYWDFWGNEDTWRTFFRCKICPDAIGTLADIAVLDIWDNCDPREENEGWNALICRTERGAALVQAMQARGDFVLDMEWTEANLNLAQPHQTAKRRAVLARHAAMTRLGLPVPAVEDPSLSEVSFAEGSPEWEAEVEGTVRRLNRGVHLRPD
jgi:coenzyme F420 hydrogenase subunit beta